MQSIKTTILTIFLTALALWGVSFVQAQTSTWVGPSTPPPPTNLANVDAPINVGNSFQVKSGPLNVEGDLGVGFGRNETPSAKLEVKGGAIKATDALIIPTKAPQGTRVDGMIWLTNL